MKRMTLNLPSFSAPLDESPVSTPARSLPRSQDPALPAPYVAILMDLAEVAAADIRPETRFREDLSLDSLDMVEMVMICEREFHVTLLDQDWIRARTVGAFAEVLKDKVAQRGHAVPEEEA